MYELVDVFLREGREASRTGYAALQFKLLVRLHAGVFHERVVPFLVFDAAVQDLLLYFLEHFVRDESGEPGDISVVFSECDSAGHAASEMSDGFVGSEMNQGVSLDKFFHDIYAL